MTIKDFSIEQNINLTELITSIAQRTNYLLHPDTDFEDIPQYLHRVIEIIAWSLKGY